MPEVAVSVWLEDVRPSAVRGPAVAVEDKRSASGYTTQTFYFWPFEPAPGEEEQDR